MKISNSKRQLAQLLIEAGVTQFPDGANWAAQDKSGMDIYCYKNKPRRPLGWESWHHDGGVVTNGEFETDTLTPNWHQTALSRAEFDQIVAETSPDADGWIEWNGGECPVELGSLIDVKYRDGHIQLQCRAKDRRVSELYATNYWGSSGGSADIIAYRLHKPEQAEANPAERDEQVWTNPPTIEQLAADYRNAKDYADRKQQEADAAKADADARLKALEIAAEDLGFKIEQITTNQDWL